MSEREKRLEEALRSAVGVATGLRMAVAALLQNAPTSRMTQSIRGELPACAAEIERLRAALKED